MTIADFRKRLQKILNPESLDERQRLRQRVEVSNPGTPIWKISVSDREVASLVVEFIHDELTDPFSKSSLLEKLNRINQLCSEEVCTRGYVNEELTFQASSILTHLARECATFEEFRTILVQCDGRILDGVSKTSVEIGALVHLK